MTMLAANWGGATQLSSVGVCPFHCWVRHSVLVRFNRVSQGWRLDWCPKRKLSLRVVFLVARVTRSLRILRLGVVSALAKFPLKRRVL